MLTARFSLPRFSVQRPVYPGRLILAALLPLSAGLLVWLVACPSYGLVLGVGGLALLVSWWAAGASDLPSAKAKCSAGRPPAAGAPEPLRVNPFFDFLLDAPKAG
ncbi:hypothetical protein [Hymenobacter algoricola]|uniref:DUF58 domain-containing protein n=1 Tax=Hymenobacter algoricola TaxID=486267 RepID=A0ABP7N211_9BACT